MTVLVAVLQFHQKTAINIDAFVVNMSLLFFDNVFIVDGLA